MPAAPAIAQIQTIASSKNARAAPVSHGKSGNALGLPRAFSYVHCYFWADVDIASHQMRKSKNVHLQLVKFFWFFA